MLCIVESPAMTAETQTASAFKNSSDDNCIQGAENSCACPVTPNTVFITQERETISPPTIVLAAIPFAPAQFHALMPRSNLPDSKAEQSPTKKASTPLFVQFCTFRI